MLICVTGFPDPTPSTWVTEAASDFPGALGSEAFSAALYTLEDQQRLADSVPAGLEQCLFGTLCSIVWPKK